MELDFEIINRNGIKHQAVDALSRLPMNGSAELYLKVISQTGLPLVQISYTSTSQALMQLLDVTPM